MKSPHKGKTGVERLLAASGYSLAGLVEAVKNEVSFRYELSIAAVMIPAGLYLGATGVEKAMLVGCVVLTLVIELVNSAVEATVDRVSLDDHPLAKRAKDIGSAAVLMALVNVAAVWGLVLLG